MMRWGGHQNLVAKGGNYKGAFHNVHISLLTNLVNGGGENGQICLSDTMK